MRIVLVEPQHPGNIGAVARAMANFGLNDLAMVKGCELADESYARSKSGRPVLEKSKRYGTIEEAIADCDIAIGTSGIRPEGDKRWFRAPQDVKKINEIMTTMNAGTVIHKPNNLAEVLVSLSLGIMNLKKPF